MDMRTDLTAVPHAGLSYLEGLRCQEIVGLKAIGFGLEVNAGLLRAKT